MSDPKKIVEEARKVEEDKLLVKADSLLNAPNIEDAPNSPPSEDLPVDANADATPEEIAMAESRALLAIEQSKQSVTAGAESYAVDRYEPVNATASVLKARLLESFNSEEDADRVLESFYDMCQEMDKVLLTSANRQKFAESVSDIIFKEKERVIMKNKIAEATKQELLVSRYGKQGAQEIIDSFHEELKRVFADGWVSVQKAMSTEGYIKSVIEHHKKTRAAFAEYSKGGVSTPPESTAQQQIFESPAQKRQFDKFLSKVTGKMPLHFVNYTL